MTTTWINLGNKDEPVPGNENLPRYKEIREALIEIKAHPGLYTTRVAPIREFGGANWEYEFRTSSKEIHLGFGRMDAKLMWRLAQMLHEAMERGQGADQLALKYDDRLVFVTRVAGTPTDIITFNLASNR